MTKSRVKRCILWPLEALPLYAVYGLVRILPVDWASGLLGGLAKAVGPLLPVSDRIRRNLRLVMPELNRREQAEIVREVWQTMGATIGEFPHMGWLCKGAGISRFEVQGQQHLDALRKLDRPVIFFSAHLGNWEACMVVESLTGIPTAAVYRRPDNPYVETLYAKSRAHITGGLVAKGAQGAHTLIRHMRQKKHLGMLLDQKMNDGIPVPFFNRPAMTAPAAAQFALKYDAVLVPLQVIRLGGVHFKFIVHKPLDIPGTGDVSADILTIMTEVNGHMERWIRENPGQWLWLHRRWPESRRPEAEDRTGR